MGSEEQTVSNPDSRLHGEHFNRLRYVIVGHTLPSARHTLHHRLAYVVNAGNTLSIRRYKLSKRSVYVSDTLGIRPTRYEYAMYTPNVHYKHRNFSVCQRFREIFIRRAYAG